MLTLLTRTWILIFVASSVVACQTTGPTRRPVPAAAPPLEQLDTRPVPAERAASAPPKAADAPTADRQAPDIQELLDEALEFCQVSQDFWARGDLDSAISALDQAYSLILAAQTAGDPELNQQKEDLRLTVAKRMLEIYASRNTALNGTHQAIPTVINADVEAEIRLFQGTQRRFFLNAYRRCGPYRRHILAALKQAGLPEELAWLPLIESGFKTRALSPARALGLWQFIPSTGHRFGLKRDEWIDERMHPDKSTRAAVAYLTELHRTFGDWLTALAAYNCGAARVLRVIRRQNINYLDRFWDLYEQLPKETRRYVPRFLAALAIINDPVKYGFELKAPTPTIAFEEVTVPKPVRLADIANALGVQAKVLEALNPELRRAVTPPGEYALRVPAGQGTELRTKLDEIAAYTPPKRRYIYHRIRPDETLSHLAVRYRTSVAAIARLNKMRTGAILRLDRMLKIPANGRLTTRKGGPRPPPAAGRRTIRYRVARGDSIWLIARRFETDVQTLQRLNGLNNTQLRVGQRLWVPAVKKKTQPPAGTRIYRVKPGDSPFQIALEHGMPLERFLRINRLTTRSRIYPGQSLLVDDK